MPGDDRPPSPTRRGFKRLWDSPTLTTWGSLTARVGGALLLLPLVLTHFAPAEVAVWQLFASLAVLAAMLDFGLAPTLVRLVAYGRAGASLDEMARLPQRATLPDDVGVRPPDRDALQRQAQTLRWLYPRLALGAALLFAVVGTGALGVPVAQVADPARAWMAWALVLVGAAATLWSGGYGAALQGMNHLAALRRWETGVGLAQLACSVPVLLAGGDLLALVAVQQACTVWGAIGTRRMFRRRHPELAAGAAARHDAVLRVLWPAAWRSGVGVLASHGVVQLSGVAYGQVAPPTEVAAYLIALRVMSLISAFSQAPFYGRLPVLASLYSGGRRDELLHQAASGIRWSHAVFVAGALAAGAAAAPALAWLDSPVRFVTPQVWAAMALAFAAERFGAMHLQLYSLGNRIVWHVANGVSGALMVLLATATYAPLGTLAFPLSMLVAYAGFYSVYAVRLSRRLLTLPLVRFELRSSVPALVVLLIGLAVLQVLPRP